MTEMENSKAIDIERLVRENIELKEKLERERQLGIRLIDKLKPFYNAELSDDDMLDVIDTIYSGNYELIARDDFDSGMFTYEKTVMIKIKLPCERKKGIGK